MMKNEFYMVLPSDISMEYYPDNTVACFTTHLPEEIRLNGRWGVGVQEFTVSYTFSNIPTPSILSLEYIGKDGELNQPRTDRIVQRGYYRNKHALLLDVNNLLNIQNVFCKLNNNGYTLFIYKGGFTDKQWVYSKLPHNLARILGYDKGEITFSENETIIYSRYAFNLHSSLPANYMYTVIFVSHILLVMYMQHFSHV